MKTLEVSSFGPIKRGRVDFGDLTILVGPQATGKSLFVQLFKAIEDAGSVRTALKQYGFAWSHEQATVGNFLSVYLGGGMESVWREETSIAVDGRKYDFQRVANPRGRPRNETESVFLIPAQRVLVLRDGWPRPFMDYSPGDPYCMRNFSEALRRLMEQGVGRGDAIFPQAGRLKSELRGLIDRSIYTGAKLQLNTEGMRKRIVLRPQGSATTLPYSVWSAGQREFTPLLMGMYWLMPSTKIKMKGGIQTVIIEEPEMGLHPQAIVAFCFLVLELLWRGYKVIISTHSPVVLDVVWALRELSTVSRDVALSSLRDLVGIKRLTPGVRDVFDSALEKEHRVYYFDHSQNGVLIRDISSLNPGDDDENISGWGGLSGFSGHIADVVGEALRAGRTS